MRAAVAWLLLIPLALGVVSGCSVLPPPPTPPKKAVLEKLPAEIPQGDTSAKGLLVTLPEAEAIFDTTGIAYTNEPYELGYFSEYVWAEKPVHMIQGLLVRTLQGTHQFREVVVPPHFAGYDYVLNSRVLALTQDYNHNPPLLRAAMDVQFVDASNNRIIAAKGIATQEPITEKSPYGGVVAANEAIARLMREIALFALDATTLSAGEK